jgi:hypothetical protein
LNEWLSLMLEEIRRKAREREEASSERARRAAAARQGPEGVAPEAGTRKHGPDER